MSAPTPPPSTPLQPTPLLWRVAIAAGVLLLAVLAFLLRGALGPRGVALAGVVCFIGLAAVFSADLRRISWRTVGGGILLQVLLALFILRFEVFGRRPGFELFAAIGNVVRKFLEFSDAGARFVFGKLADPSQSQGFVFAFSALPTIIFVSSFFTVLYYFGVLQLVVRLFARVMMWLLNTSGAETLSAAANVFMGQTEAPLIVKPYVERMTRSELLAMMVGGMATISGGVMAVYIGMGADPVAILATSVMAAPCGLYLSKIILPETEEPLTRGEVKTADESTHRNVIDAASGGASDGLMLALNIAAMLIAFLALIALVDYLLGSAGWGLRGATVWLFPEEGRPWWVADFLALEPEKLSLRAVFAFVFWPVAFLMGVTGEDISRVASLLGTKLVANEFVAYTILTDPNPLTGAGIARGSRAFVLATYALTGFANFSSIGIQLGGIGAMAPSRRGDLAQLGTRALLAGFLATLINASLAGILMDFTE